MPVTLFPPLEWPCRTVEKENSHEFKQFILLFTLLVESLR